jgi:tripartite-type tricarboxylate transporter receptor subunit TctC
MTRVRWWLAAVLMMMLAAATPQLTQAQSYPTRPVKILVPYPPGGPNDIVARVLAQKLSEATGGNFYVENQPGAGGTLATGALANAAPDGYTLIVVNQDVIVQPIIKSKVPYDPFKSFTPVTLVVGAPEMIVVHPSVPAKDLKELLALLKANPGKYSYASPGYGTTPHLAGEWLFKVANKLDVTHVPFQGAAPAVQSTLSGQTPIFHNVLPAVAPHIRAGTMRPLAVAAATRSPHFPDVPTIAEAGSPGHEVAFWTAVLAPAGTPKDVIDLLNSQIARAIALPDIKDRLNTIGFDPILSTPEAAAAHMKAETEKWLKVVREANIKIE